MFDVTLLWYVSGCIQCVADATLPTYVVSPRNNELNCVPNMRAAIDIAAAVIQVFGVCTGVSRN